MISALLFNIAIDWVLRRTEDQLRGIRWTLFTTPEDLDLADDLTLVSHTHQQIQEKKSRLSIYGQQRGLEISQKKSDVMTLNIPNSSSVLVNGEDISTTEEFIFLVSTIRHDEGADSDIKNRLSEAKNDFGMLSNV